VSRCSCITAQTIDAAKSKGSLEELCRWYASEVDRLQSSPTPDGDPDVAVELAEARRHMGRLNQRIAVQNDVIDALRKKAG
jgi:hypothetical protein